jgi:hypothetical protein
MNHELDYRVLTSIQWLCAYIKLFLGFMDQKILPSKDLIQRLQRKWKWCVHKLVPQLSWDQKYCPSRFDTTGYRGKWECAYINLFHQLSWIKKYSRLIFLPRCTVSEISSLGFFQGKACTRESSRAEVRRKEASKAELAARRAG